MIIAHLADAHLGFRAYSRVTPDGRNQREADVADAFARTLDAVGALRPDLVLVAGDLFHSVRPSNAAISAAFRGFTRLAARLEGAPVVVVAGDRETPRSADTASILDLFREIQGVAVVTERVEALPFPALDAEVVAVPHAALAEMRELRLPASGGAGVRVLLAHGRLGGGRAEALPGGALADGGATLPPALIESGEWSYVALGHHPTAVEIAPNAWYAGSIERTSPDPWAEATSQKGFVLFDTGTGEASFQSIETRAVLDLPRVSARGLDAAAVDAAIQTVLREVEGGLDGRIVRLVVADLSRAGLRRLDGRVLREARAAALHFLLDARPPAASSTQSGLLAARGVSLESLVEGYLMEVWQPTMEGTDRATLVALARRYLEQASEGGHGGVRDR